MAEGISGGVAWRLRKAVSKGSDKKPPQTGTAVVKRRDGDGTLWVRLPGSTVDTPVTGAVVASVKAGDTVSYAISGGRVSISGNASDPSVGEAVVSRVRRAAQQAHDLARKASDIATATGQHFWSDDNGAHVSTEDGNPAGARNAIWNSLGMLFRAGTTNLLAIVAGDDSGVDIYDGEGNSEDNVVASLRKSALKLWNRGDGYTSQLVITARSIAMYIDDLPGAARKVLQLATSGSKIDSKLTVQNPKDPYAGTITVGAPDTATASFGATSVGSGTSKSLGKVSGVGAGVWVVVALVEFPANASGIRRIGLSDDGEMPTSGPLVSVNAVATGPTRVLLTWIVNNGGAPNSAAPFIHPPLYLVAYQNSGSALSCTGHIRAVHIS